MDFKIVGTAGHIDHGKSALVRALTGTDPDRLQEERERGITIDLGFASMSLDAGTRVGFIDVPGHERFVKNMLAGIGGIDAVMFVVAADESIMPQTREHLAICELLGIDRGVVALTKCDLVDDEIAELVRLEVRELLAGTGLAEAPIVRTSAQSGAGLDRLSVALAAALDAAAARSDAAFTRMPVDRVFTMKGFGTVVTGTLLSGTIGGGDKLELLPRGSPVTVRGVQAYGEAVAAATPGQRTAVNLQGIDLGEVARGDILVSAGSLPTTYLLDARLDLLDEHPLEHLQRVRFHHGATETLCRIAVLDTEYMAPGSSARVQLRLETPYACVPGDRFVIRRYSPMLTIGGGVIIDNAPRKHRRSDPRARQLLTALEDATLARRLAALVDDTGDAGADANELGPRMFRNGAELAALATALEDEGGVVIARPHPLLLIATDRVVSLEKRALAAIAAFHDAQPLAAAAPKNAVLAALPRRTPQAVVDKVLERLAARGVVRVDSDGIALAQHAVRLDDRQQRLRDSLVEAFRAAGWSPATLGEVVQSLDAAAGQTEAVLHLLLRQGELVRLRDDLVYHRDHLERLIEEVRQRHAAGEGFSVSDFKHWTGLSRKHAIPLLEHLDQSRVTRRDGDRRVRV